MIITVTKKYLVFPVNTQAPLKKLSFSAQSQTVYALDIKLDDTAPDFEAYIDLSRFAGQTLELSVQPEMNVSWREEDEMSFPDLYRERLRPQVHFSTKNGWINDPNGLIWLDGEYHMFYQHNPAENIWNNMHWGHAVSRDLFHWEEKDLVLYPEAWGHAFSGSAIVDDRNLLGLADENGPAALLIYTATEPFSQHIAWSTDGFRTVHRLEDNPVVPHIIGGNRDPKVSWCEELKAYVMALYLDGCVYGILKSENLRDWTLLQRFEVEGENECPDLFPITDSRGGRKWVFMGARDRYIVGEFKDGSFVPLQSVKDLHYGASAYAGQTFSNLPEGRVVRIAWSRWHDLSAGDQRMNGHMTVPMELKLLKDDSEYYLTANPVCEIESVMGTETSQNDILLTGKVPETFPLKDSAYLIRLKGQYAAGTVLDISVFGCPFRVDMEQNLLTACGKSGPLSAQKRQLDLTVIVDRCSLELFSDGGRTYMSFADDRTVADRGRPEMELLSHSDYQLDSVACCPLKSVWTKE